MPQRPLSGLHRATQTGVFADVRLEITPVTRSRVVLALPNSLARHHVASRWLIETMLDSDETSRTMICSAVDLVSTEEARSVVEPTSEETAFPPAQTSGTQVCAEVE